jgi:hypothetical protein
MVLEFYWMAVWPRCSFEPYHSGIGGSPQLEKQLANYRQNTSDVWGGHLMGIACTENRQLTTDNSERPAYFQGMCLLVNRR